MVLITRIPSMFAFLFLFVSVTLGQHSLQLDNGLGAYSILMGSSSGGTYTLPTGGGTILTDNGSGVSNAWLTTGNAGTTPGTNFVGTTNNVALYLQAKNGATILNSLILNTNGSIQRDPGNNPRGASAVDMQIARGWVTEVAAGQFSTISGGSTNTVNGTAATVGGGFANVVYGDYSSVPGGRGLTLGGNADGTFGFLAANLGANDMSIDIANTAVFGNTNMWLANNTNAASELRFYEANATASGAFPPALLNYTAFKAGAQTADITYILPTVDPTAGQVLSASLPVANVSTLSWTAASGLVNFTESLTIVAPYSGTDAAARLLATNATATHISVVLQPKGNGALQAQLADNTAAGGNKRGINAVDWQMSRTLGIHVASNDYSTIGGGTSNIASGVGSTISGGSSNTASSPVSTVGGGSSNIAGAIYSTVGGGVGNNVSGPQATISGGASNTASASYSTIGGGAVNTASGDYSTIPGGRGLTLDGTATGSFGFLGNNAGGLNNMTISAANTAVFGNTNMWLANNTNAASELRFYEANATASGAFPPALLNYTAFKAGVMSANVSYTLPTALPVGSGALVSGSTGTLAWGSHGRVAATAGLVTVINDAAVTATNTIICNVEGTVTFVAVTARNVGVSFTVTSGAALVAADFINYQILP